MAKTFVQPGDVVEVAAPADRTAGQGVLVGTLFGVALHDALNTLPLRIGVSGVFTILADNNLVISAGERVFWDAANNWVDKTAAAQVCVGRATAAKAQAGTTVSVLLGAQTPAGT